jgi:serine/threonine-protein kinase
VPIDKAPEVLAERAGNVITKLGYTNPPADRAFGFEFDFGYAAHAEADSDPNRWKRITAGQPLTYYFWYRQSPRVLEPAAGTNVKPSDPPGDVSGMTSVILDPRGRLVEFSRVPPQRETGKEPEPIDWTQLFGEAGLDLAKFSSTESQWSPPNYADERVAWQGMYADHPDIPIRIEAAAYRSQPVYFRVVAPWDKPVRQEETQTTWRQMAGVLILMSVMVTVVGAAVLLTRRNLRLGRGDREGAFKLALFMFLVMVLGLLIGADHVPTPLGEILILYQIVSYALFIAVMLWLLYVALEPYVRRHWPQLLISWTRLLAGEFRDPMVGRDVLAGGLLGVGHTAAIHFSILLGQMLDDSAGPGQAVDASPLTSFSSLIEDFFTGFGVAVFAGLAPLFFLLLLYLFLRNRWTAAVVMWALVATVQILFFATSWIVAPINLLIATFVVVGVFRFGLLTAIVSHFVFNLTFFFPLTTDLSIWYANRSIFALVVLAALASYAAYISLGGQRIFHNRLLED